MREESYVPMPIENKNSTTWYIDSEAAHHVCKDAFELNNSAPYTIIFLFQWVMEHDLELHLWVVLHRIL